MSGANGARWMRGRDPRPEGEGRAKYIVPLEVLGLSRQTEVTGACGCSNAGVPLRRSSPRWLNINWIAAEVDSVNRRMGELRTDGFERVEFGPESEASEPVSRVSTTHGASHRDAAAESSCSAEAAHGLQPYAQSELKRSPPPNEQRLLDAVPGLIVAFDPGGAIIAWNRACSELLDHDFAAHLGHPFWEYVVPECEAESARREFLALVQCRDVGATERCWRTRSGELKWIHWSLSVQRDAQGRARSIMGTGLDRTSFRLHEQHLMGLAVDAKVIADGEQRITGFEGGAEQVFGWSAHEVLGNPLETLIAPASRSAYHRVVDALRTGPESDGTSSRKLDCTAQRNGSEFAAEVGISLRRGLFGSEFTLVIRDVSGRKQLEASLRREIRVRDELTRTIVHDLRNPLNSIALQAQLMVRPSDQHERRSTVATERIKRCVGHMTRLLDHLADVSRVQAGRIPLDKVPLVIGKTVREAVDSALPQACVKNIRLRIDVEEGLPILIADPTGLLQVLHNLLGNALKFCPEAGTITVGARQQEGQLRVHVTNSGLPIPEEQQVYLFEPFWQADPRSRNGAGLGLAIAKGIVEAHGGSIWVESSEQLGTTFCFALPLA